MNKKVKIFALSLLSCLAFAGCGENEAAEVRSESVAAQEDYSGIYEAMPYVSETGTAFGEGIIYNNNSGDSSGNNSITLTPMNE